MPSCCLRSLNVLVFLHIEYGSPDLCMDCQCQVLQAALWGSLDVLGWHLSLGRWPCMPVLHSRHLCVPQGSNHDLVILFRCCIGFSCSEKLSACCSDARGLQQCLCGMCLERQALSVSCWRLFHCSISTLNAPCALPPQLCQGSERWTVAMF